MISEFLEDLSSITATCVVIDHASTCLFTLADKIQPPEKSVTKVRIVHHSFQQTNFPRCSVRLVLLVQEPPHLDPVLFLSMMSDATQSPPELSKLSQRL